MDELLISVPLNPLHERIDLELLVLSELFLFFVNFEVDWLLVGLNFFDFDMVGLLSDGICFHVLFRLKMAPFKLSQANTLFGKSESVVPRKNILPLLNNLQIMLFPHFPERLISGSFIILHVNVPSVSKFDELVPLDMFDLIKFHFLSKLGLPHLFS